MLPLAPFQQEARMADRGRNVTVPAPIDRPGAPATRPSTSRARERAAGAWP